MPYINMNKPWVPMCSPIVNSYPTSLPLGCPRALTLSALLHVGIFFTVSPEALLLRHNYC